MVDKKQIGFYTDEEMDKIKTKAFAYGVLFGIVGMFIVAYETFYLAGHGKFYIPFFD